MLCYWSQAMYCTVRLSVNVMYRDKSGRVPIRPLEESNAATALRFNYSKTFDCLDYSHL